MWPDVLYELLDRPALDDPVLVVCLDGWIDAGLAASTALAALLASVQSQVVATFDADLLLDHRARRPIMRVEDGVNTGLTWPEIQLWAGADRDGRDLLILAGPEPDHQWHAFSDAVVELAEDLDVSLAVSLGAFPAPVPHTRPCRIAATATTRDLAERVGFVPGSIEVPAGVQAAIERRFFDADIPAVGLWARVPHYVAAAPYPAASAALLEGLTTLTGLSIDTSELRQAATEARARIDQLVANNPEHAHLVNQLEQAADAETRLGGPDGTQIPSGDELAAEFERFLRDEG